MKRKIVDGISSVGRKEYEKYFAGKKLTRKESMDAFCYECTGGYADGTFDCKCNECPLYNWHPYKNKYAVTTP